MSAKKHMKALEDQGLDTSRHGRKGVPPRPCHDDLATKVWPQGHGHEGKHRTKGLGTDRLGIKVTSSGLAAGCAPNMLFN